MDVTPGTVVVYSDIGCPWSHAIVHRLHAERSRLGLDDALAFDHRAFPLELFNRRPTPKHTLDLEIPVAGALAPEAGWQAWKAQPHEYPVTTLPALEAVQAAKEQGLDASERLDRALRRAMFGECRTISMHHVILEVAEDAGVDVARLDGALRSGRARSSVWDQFEVARSDEVEGSPHVFLPDGADVHNPGVEIEWKQDGGSSFPVVVSEDADAIPKLLLAASGRGE